MPKISEQPLSEETVALIKGASRDGLFLLKLDPKDSPQAIIDALDAFVDAWQEGRRPPKTKIDPEDAPFALGSLWGEQMVRQFKWEWAMVTFHDHDDSEAPGVLSPDRALAVYPIHFLMGCLENEGVDCTVALAFNMLRAGSIKNVKPKGYFNPMDGVHRIVPKG